MDSQSQHLQPDQLHSTTEAAAMLGVAEATLRSRKSRHKDVLVKGTHWQHQDGGTFWTTTGLLAIAERTSTPQAKALLSQTAVLTDAARANNIEATPDQLQVKAGTPVQYGSARSRLIVAASIVATLILGGSGIWFTRTSATSAATSGATLQINPSVADPDASGTRGRARKIAQALTLVEQQQTAIEIHRRDYLLAQAERERRRNGTPVNQWLTRHLNVQIKELEHSAAHNPDNAQQIAIARSIAGETKATLLALRAVETNTSLTPQPYSVTTGALLQSMSHLTRQVDRQQIEEANR